MQTGKKISALLSLLITMPIWYYLIYVLLSAAHVDRLVWFLFWIYMPVGVFVRILDSLITSDECKTLQMGQSSGRRV